MEVVKSVFGLLMLGAGLYYLHIGVPAIAAATSSLSSLGVWLGPVLLVAGVAMGALHLSFKYTNALEKMRKTIGVALATVGLVVVIASLTTDAAPAHTNSEGIAWTRITGTPDALERFNGALATAQKSCKPVMIDFFADWCIACKELDAHTYVDDNVQHEAARFATVKVDATNDSPMLDSIQKRYGIVGLPTVVFIDSHGRTLVDPYVTGFVAPAEYLTLMQRVH
jgi:thiol:disulfide interchange protein DsbD